MNNSYKKILFENVKGNNNEYIIKDSFGISIGRLFTLEMNKINKFCLFRLKFYRYEDEGEILLREILNEINIMVFDNYQIYKINIIVDEDILFSPFIKLGYKLDGIFNNSIYQNNSCRDEFIFGIDRNTYSNNSISTSVHLKGKNIELKLLTPLNSEELLEYYLGNKEYLKPFEPSREDEFYTLPYQKNTLIESYKQYLNGTNVNFGIYMRERFIGKIQVSNIVFGVFRSAFVGYSIDEKEQGKGYMKEALNLVLKYAFNDLKLHRIEASTLIDNIRSQNVLKSCGFKELGINKKYLFINGKWRDHITFYKIEDK